LEDGVRGVGDAVVTGSPLKVGALEGEIIGSSVAGGDVGAGSTFPNETESSHTAPKISGGTVGKGSKLKTLY
jgi:hypothetical protein